MSLLQTFVQRIVIGIVTIWAVLTLVFAMFMVFTRDWALGTREGMERRDEETDEADVDAMREEYLAARDLDRSTWEIYVDWMTNMFTLDWGTPFQDPDPRINYAVDEPVLSLITSALLRTAMYVLPALVLAIAIGILIGLLAALHPNNRLTGAGVGTAYLLFALPSFWVGGMLLSLANSPGFFGYSPLVFEHVLPIFLTAALLVGGYVSYARAHSLEYASVEFVTLVRAKGAGPKRIATHVVRNAAIPLFSMLFTEVLALLVLAVFIIETLFEIQGFGYLMFEGVHFHDIPLILGCTMVIIAFGVLGNVVQDVSYTILDPRVDTGTR